MLEMPVFVGDNAAWAAELANDDFARQAPLNQRVEGSSPSSPTIKSRTASIGWMFSSAMFHVAFGMEYT